MKNGRNNETAGRLILCASVIISITMLVMHTVCVSAALTEDDLRLHPHAALAHYLAVDHLSDRGPSLRQLTPTLQSSIHVAHLFHAHDVPNTGHPLNVTEFLVDQLLLSSVYESTGGRGLHRFLRQAADV